MRRFISLVLLIPIFYGCFLFAIAGFGEKKYEEISTWEHCKDAYDFVDCSISSNDELRRYSDAILKLQDLEKRNLDNNSFMASDVKAKISSARFEVKEAYSLKNDYFFFKQYIKDISEFCKYKHPADADGEYQSEYFLCKFEAGEVNYKFTSRKLVPDFRAAAIGVVPLLVLLIFLYLKRSFVKSIFTKEGFAFVLKQKQYRLSILFSLFWFSACFAIFLSTEGMSSFNPLKEPDVWILYLIGLYPLLIILFTYYILSANDEN